MVVLTVILYQLSTSFEFIYVITYIFKSGFAGRTGEESYSSPTSALKYSLNSQGSSEGWDDRYVSGSFFHPSKWERARERETNCEGKRKEVGSATRCRSKEITSWEKNPLSELSEKWIFIFRDYGQLPSLIFQHINKWRKNRSVRVRGDFSWSKYPLRSGWGALDRSSCGAPFRVATPGQHRRRAIPARLRGILGIDRRPAARPPLPTLAQYFYPCQKIRKCGRVGEGCSAVCSRDSLISFSFSPRTCILLAMRVFALL